METVNVGRSVPAGDKAQRVSVDLDGVLNLGETFRGAHHFSPVRTGAASFLKSLHDDGFEVVIFTARPVEPAKLWLRQNGLMRWVNDVSNTKLPSRVYVDDRALNFRGDFNDTLGQVEKFKAHWEPQDKPKHDYSTVQVDLPPEITEKVKAIAAKIPDEELAVEGKEPVPHITVKYGLHQDTAGDLPKKLQGFGHVNAKFGPLSLFEQDEHDVLKIEVDSPDLHRLNGEVCRYCPHVDTYPDYKPHATVAYLKKGTGKKYAGRSPLAGTELRFTEATFMAKDGSATPIRLGE